MRPLIPALATLTLFLTLPSITSGQARKKAEKDTDEWRYELEAVGEGKEGTYVFKVWTYSKRAIVAIEQAKKNAVHGIIFKGYAGKDRIQGRPALSSDPNLVNTKADFFEPFFADGGDYMKFVSNSGDTAPERLKVGKEYKVGIITTVAVADLRRHLEAAGIIKGLGSGF